MKTGIPAVLAVLLLAAGPAFAADDGIGPWRPGMSKEEVVAFTDFGPYTDIAGGVETDAARIKNRKGKASIAFDDRGLRSIQMLVYEGKDWRKAQQVALDVFDYFKAEHGGANVKDAADNPGHDELELILRRTLGTAEDMNKRYAQNGSAMTMTFDMVPLRQPEGSRLHCQWAFLGKTGTYVVILYRDRPGAPSRDAEESSKIEKL